MSKPRRSREAAYQVMYAMDMAGSDRHQMVVAVGAVEDEDVRSIDEFASELLSHFENNRARIDSILSASSTRWTIDRMGAPDRALLRLGITELLYCPERPYKVVIDEYIELAKKYGDAESPRFVNGLLDRVRREQQTPPSA